MDLTLLFCILIFFFQFVYLSNWPIKKNFSFIIKQERNLYQIDANDDEFGLGNSIPKEMNQNSYFHFYKNGNGQFICFYLMAKDDHPNRSSI